ncbi:MAG: 2Fe-2S iron-sulfur cluster binding domain-containing protein [Candidatus Omnitrophica bacterium]|nr:2Fe-2S iron-sulfur cluster binding domain-containing protein [Candidatus Omnitrophota bacterium]
MNGILVVIAILLVAAEKFLVTYGECKITINKEKILTVNGGGSLLSLFAENKIFIPSACGGKATCGYCKVEVLSGGGTILPTEEVFVSRQERLKGVRLACQVKVKNDLEVLISPDLLQAQEFSVTVIDIKDLTSDIKHVFLRLDDPASIKFKPGQYMQFKIPETDEFRAYSAASAPSQTNLVELIVRLVPNGLCSTYIHEALDINDKIVLTGPFGDFYLREDSQRSIVCIGGGCGMAPIRSILYHLKEKGMSRKVMYFFGARSKKDLFFTDELFALQRQFPNFKYVPALSEPKPQDNWRGETGLITQAVEKMMPDGSNTEAYLCGPPPMIDASIKVLTKKGVREIHIYYDKF